jgi:hypothetical protein
LRRDIVFINGICGRLQPSELLKCHRVVGLLGSPEPAA